MKRSLRKTIRQRLAAMAPAVAHAKSMSASKRLMAQPEFERAQTIMIYLPVAGEVDLSPIALRAWQQQKVVAAPKTSWDQRHMIPIQIRSLETGLVTARYGLREPADGDPLAPDALDLVIVPGLAFDRRGHRLGKGAGFYDRFMSSPGFRAAKAALAFTEQVVVDVPVGEHDVPIDMLVTDEEVLRFSPASGTGGEGGEDGRPK